MCPLCARWNLAPLDVRWETVDECERRFRATSLRYSSGNIGLAWLKGDVELIRVGPALRPEVAAWRYGRVLTRPRPFGRRTMERAAAVFVGGEITAAWDLFAPAITTEIERRALSPVAALTPVIPEPPGSHPRLHGATALMTATHFAAPVIA